MTAPAYDVQRARSSELIELVNALPATDKFVVLGQFAFLLAGSTEMFEAARAQVELTRAGS